MRDLSNVRRIVIKVGTNLLSSEQGIDEERVRSICRQIAELRNMGYQVILVSSGAVGLGAKELGHRNKVVYVTMRQACAAIGQPVLMYHYREAFREFGIIAAQVLLTRNDLNNRKTYNNLRSSVSMLLSMGVVPIFNENDAVCISEIKFGDNDTLSAIVASRTDADLLVILSDVAGLYNADPTSNPDAKLVPVVWNIDDVRHMAGDSVSGVGTGGMKTKLSAAKVCHDAACSMIIALSKEDQVIYRACTGEDVGTIFIADSGISKKRRWIKSAHPSGRIIIDDGARKAVLDHKSLLPVGIRDVEGRFNKGDVVEIVCSGDVVAKGIIDYDSTDIKMIKGKHSDEIEFILGFKAHDDAVISENIALLL